MSYDYFCYDPDTGFETYNTPEGAKQAAEEAIDYYRDNADEGWNEEVCGVCWGKINQRTVETLSLSIKEAENQGISLPEECSGFSDYGLIDVLPDNHDRLVEENKRLREGLEAAKAEVKKISNSIDALDVWIDNESSCAEWVSIDVIKSRLGKMYGRALRLLSELSGE